MTQRYLLDTTLRDGSNVIGFQFDASAVSSIVRGLSQAQVDLIELGHGCGIGAAETVPQFKAPCSDRQYLEIARAALAGPSRLGVVVTTLLTKPVHMEPLWDLVDFVRVSFDVNQPDSALPLIDMIKARGKVCSLQLVYSSRYEPHRLLDVARRLEGAGADTVYVVDTLGTMMPAEVFQKITLLCQHTKINVGFHGHNHLQLAMANTLEALRAGATFVDGCLHSMGKGPGNAQTEILAKFLNDQHGGQYHLPELLETSDVVVKPLLQKTSMGTSPYYLHSALSDVDLPVDMVLEFAQRGGVTPAKVIEIFGELPPFFVLTDEHLRYVAQRLRSRTAA